MKVQKIEIFYLFFYKILFCLVIWVVHNNIFNIIWTKLREICKKNPNRINRCSRNCNWKFAFCKNFPNLLKVKIIFLAKRGTAPIFTKFCRGLPLDPHITETTFFLGLAPSWGVATKLYLKKGYVDFEFFDS